MGKQRKWHLALIVAVIGLTIYNIIPTLLFYTKPLKTPIGQAQAEQIAQEIAERTDQLQNDSIEWLKSYCNLLNIKPLSLSREGQLFSLVFAKNEDATLLRKYLPRAGSLIPFFPAQLGIAPSSDNPKEVLVQRRIPLQLSTEKELFSFIPKSSEAYQSWILERTNAVKECLSSPPHIRAQELSEQALALSSSIQTLAKIHAQYPELGERIAARIAKIGDASALTNFFDRARDAIKEDKAKGGSNERLHSLEQKEIKIAAAETFVKKHTGLFTTKKILNPFFRDVIIDGSNDQLRLVLYPDTATVLAKGSAEMKQLIEQLLIDEVAHIARETNEQIRPISEGYSIPLHTMPAATGFLCLKLDALATRQAEQLLQTIHSEWHPTHPDLQQLPIVSAKEYSSLSSQAKALCLVVDAPAADETPFANGLQKQSIYVFAKGIFQIFQSYEQSTESEPAKLLMKEFHALEEIMQRQGLVGFPGINIGLNQDFVFERRNSFTPLLAATREDFHLYGDRHKAVLELSDVEQRILTLNKIETLIHEDLIKWHDEYNSAQVSMAPALRYDVPTLTKSLFWNNIQLSFRKLFRGDDRKILRWGLDLSGGKTVQIELRDQNQRLVADEADLKQGINELFNRVNKMGVSDVSIRQVGHCIVLDFPGGQALSATDLVKASSMYFHIVNEKFGPANSALSEISQRFLQEVWNEAVVQGKKDSESVHAIAYRHLYGEEGNGAASSEAAKALLNQGLKLADPKNYASTSQLDDTLSRIVLFRGTDFNEWQGQAHPLLIVMNNYALEGANLDHIRSNYDPSKGNFLAFDIKGFGPSGTLNEWTSRYCKEEIIGTSRESCSMGRGWRMAVLLNNTVISSPTLESALRDSASITGSFSQREINQFVSDLKAGSLTFTPHILSEKNVSPELGKSDRMQGIFATLVALALVIGAMVLYYRFAGLIASIAVLFNLLILWATLQNLGASLSLAGIAGVILTVGMAVDANVLVFERIKEEFSLSGKISSAIHAGYEKAFSAIVDSNVTTIIAALILLNFDAGPIKAFAVSMIIGIASSMFTALFMTRFYFNRWLQNPHHKSLSMANWIHTSKVNFLKKAPLAFATALAIIAVGGFLLFQQRTTIFGMDFTGGYALSIELEKTALDPVHEIEGALIASGAAPRDFQIRQHNPPTHLSLMLGTGMERVGKPFHNMPLEIETGPNSYSFQKNPRIQWVVDSFNKTGLTLSPNSLKTLDTNWTAMSGQMSESMRNNALLGLLIAFISIFVYIAFRFEYKYAISAIVCLLHDVLITLGLIGLLHAFKIPVQIDLNTIAALMTIIGYSLNDTIIIFDRIREESRLYPHLPLSEIVNGSLNATLSRTTITSGTTLLVLLALLILGGASIFSFSLVMVIGVVFGTLSSWFIASPLMLFFHRKEEGLVKST
jgi:SecD/SecF fusion protein